MNKEWVKEGVSEGACEVREKEASDRGGSARENETKAADTNVVVNTTNMNNSWEKEREGRKNELLYNINEGITV